MDHSRKITLGKTIRYTCYAQINPRLIKDGVIEYSSRYREFGPDTIVRN